MDPSCGFCLGSSCNGFPGWTDPNCPEHGAPQLCQDPEDLQKVAEAFVFDDPGARQTDLVGNVMKHYRGKVNPKSVVDAVRSAKKKVTPKQRAGHTADCTMDGCVSIPKCKVEAMVKKLEQDVLRLSDEHHQKLIADLQRRGII